MLCEEDRPEQAFRWRAAGREEEHRLLEAAQQRPRGAQQGRLGRPPGLWEAAPRQPGASLPLPPPWASLSYPRSGCPGHGVPGARPAPPCPASGSLQRLPPTAGHTLDSPSKIPPKGPGPHREGPREEGKDSVISALKRWDRPAWHWFRRDFLKKYVPGRGLGWRLGLAPRSRGSRSRLSHPSEPPCAHLGIGSAHLPLPQVRSGIRRQSIREKAFH